jgi:uncharacterized membrane protein YjjB (DUF3815 family)
VAYALAAGLVGLCAAMVASVQSASASIYAGVAILPLVPGFTLYGGYLRSLRVRTQSPSQRLGKQPSYRWRSQWVLPSA